MNKMSTNGWNTKRLIEGFWTFEKGKENEYTYRVFYFRGMNKKAINDKIKELSYNSMYLMIEYTKLINLIKNKSEHLQH